MEELIYIKANVESKAVINVTKKVEFMDYFLNLKISSWVEYSIDCPYARKFIVLRCGIFFMFLKYTIKEYKYNPSINNFNVAIVDSGYMFRLQSSGCVPEV